MFFSTPKEPNFFSAKYDYRKNDPNAMTENEYLDLFLKVRNETVIGEASGSYLYYYKTAHDIKKMSPDAKILISLRNPIERAYSAYMHLVRDRREVLNFESALKKEDRRIHIRMELQYRF